MSTKIPIFSEMRSLVGRLLIVDPNKRIVADTFVSTVAHLDD